MIKKYYKNFSFTIIASVTLTLRKSTCFNRV